MAFLLHFQAFLGSLDEVGLHFLLRFFYVCNLFCTTYYTASLSFIYLLTNLVTYLLTWGGGEVSPGQIVLFLFSFVFFVLTHFSLVTKVQGYTSCSTSCHQPVSGLLHSCPPFPASPTTIVAHKTMSCK